MPEAATAAVPRGRAAGPHGHASGSAMLAGQVRYAGLEFWRTPVSAFFTLVFPLSFLVILSAMYGNEVVDPSTGLRLAQYTTPVFAVFGACMACYMSLGLAVAVARASGVLKRLRGTPLPPSVHLAGRVLASVLIAALAVGIMVGVGVAFYDVQLIPENVPALLLTFVVGTACFSALGLAVASVAPTPSAASAFANASLIILSFISGIFGFGALPEWMDRVASAFPLKPFVEAFSDGFNPAVDAAVPAWDDLAVMAAWGLAGALVVWRAFGWEPRAGRVIQRRRRGAPIEEPEEQPEAVAQVPGAVGVGRGTSAGSGGGGETGTNAVPDQAWQAVDQPGPPGAIAVVGLQARYAALQLVRDPMSLFFAVLFPVLLVAFFSSIYSDEATWNGLALPQYLAAAFSVYGVATSGLVNVPGSIAEHRSMAILKRLRGTPVPPWSYVVGRVVAVVVLGLVTVALVFLEGVLLFSVTLPPSTWAATLLTFVLSICCFAAAGLAIVAFVDRPQAVTAMALSILLPLSFISDIFIQVDQMPTVLNAIGWFFPLRHSVHAAVTATSGGALDAQFWLNLGAVLVWTLGTGVVAWRWFRWEPRRSAS